METGKSDKHQVTKFAAPQTQWAGSGQRSQLGKNTEEKCIQKYRKKGKLGAVNLW